jgi:predicted nucleic acid-binding OB-fold protein
MEQAYQAPAALPAVEQNLIPDKDDTFVKFGNFNDIKKIIQSRIFILRSLRVFRVMVKRSVWSKFVLNLIVN